MLRSKGLNAAWVQLLSGLSPWRWLGVPWDFEKRTFPTSLIGQLRTVSDQG
jgi:hypothetical protein